MKITFYALVFVTFATNLAAIGSPGPEVSTTLGKVAGVVEDGVQVYRGIPYAAPPVGKLRWRAPQPAAPWKQTLDAGEYGPVCPQMRATSFPEDEDCLTLNVWTPAKDGRLPVMVWIHGGAHVNGSGRTNGASFARDDVVLVSINYRLGRFGVFAHPELSDSLPSGEPAANFAVLDQIAALKWVQREIAAFGGDPDRVTIFGVSAGGSYVNLLMVSPLANGLFHGAISESGANGLSQLRDLGALEQIGKELAERKDADDIEDLRKLPWQSLVERNAAYRRETNPVIDGLAIAESVPDAFREGRQNNVPYIAGANSFEGSLAAAIPIPAYDRILDENRDRVSEVYEMAADDPALPREFYGDMLFVAPTRYLVSQMRTVASPAWLYHFDYVLEALDPYVPGARHGGEVPYVFDRPGPLSVNARLADRLGIPEGDYNPSAQDRQVASMMHRYWVQFARTGSPNLTGQPVWPAYSMDSDPALVFANEGVEVRSGLRSAQLDLIEEGYEDGL